MSSSEQPAHKRHRSSSFFSSLLARRSLRRRTAAGPHMAVAHGHTKAAGGHSHGHECKHSHSHSHSHSAPESKHTCKNTVHEARERSEKRKNQPQSWIARKFTVFLTVGIIAYTWYVYVGRLCAPMIKQDASALGSRSMGSELSLSGLHGVAHSPTILFC